MRILWVCLKRQCSENYAKPNTISASIVFVLSIINVLIFHFHISFLKQVRILQGFLPHRSTEGNMWQLRLHMIHKIGIGVIIYIGVFDSSLLCMQVPQMKAYYVLDCLRQVRTLKEFPQGTESSGSFKAYPTYELNSLLQLFEKGSWVRVTSSLSSRHEDYWPTKWPLAAVRKGIMGKSDLFIVFKDEDYWPTKWARDSSSMREVKVELNKTSKKFCTEYIKANLQANVSFQHLANAYAKYYPNMVPVAVIEAQAHVQHNCNEAHCKPDIFCNADTSPDLVSKEQ
eukprot:CAMPEP_0184369308 /NCGR_PEP_ID=MMETSP1089-20130417/162170_1 /TAXON_ID=38269 ORGANISM="Gloeochaete wittrockiana, Strain SAG46.84" /NCGR_SAMPLE_ID=MMETSP1089 /ASSEMBLY_ACC=CAM_ASM_000445 /LENGTH=284 /DNA_ID=CAMNT_0026711735 /DNA_START=233 /DNA_END=1088 /DNA_ORIENTATION=-